MKKILLFALLTLTVSAAETVLIRKTDGSWIEGKTNAKSVTFGSRKVAIAQILSIHNGAPASAIEQSKIQAGIAAIQGTDRAQRDQAVEDLTSIGIPVITPLLEAYKDTDQHEPRPLYRLFERIIPSNADGFDRSQSLIRLKGGALERGAIGDQQIEVDGKAIPWNEVRMLAVRQKVVERPAAAIHSLKHSTQIEYFDSGIIASASSTMDVSARGFSRLSFKEDGWATDPNGLTKPGSPAYKSHLWDSQPFGALVARIGSTGEVFFVGKALAHKALAKQGRIQFAINDNRHWQNNLGTYTAAIKVTDAYDTGEGQ
jgi:hypothetical protein